jgi:two-component system chemotaxis response regulator CheB
MFSTLTQRGAVTTLEALSAGASDYVTKPANVGSVLEGMNRLRTELVPKIKALCRRGPSALVQAPATAPFPMPSGDTRPMASPPPALRLPPIVPPGPPSLQPHAGQVDVLCIGTSTGGPNALVDLFTVFPADLPVPVLVVQHMPPVFTQMLAERLNRLGTLRFVEGAQGMAVVPGVAYIAPGGFHMDVVRVGTGAALRIHDGAPENSCRPAVDVLFRSAVEVYGGRILAAVLTGMGHDGLRGCEAVRRRGGQVVIQDEASSVVWGMPGAVAAAGLHDRMLPLPQIGPELVRRVNSGRPAPRLQR